jgi:prophage antirepressor-like protein
MNESAVVPFSFESHEIRTVVIDGEPWWVAKDVCDVLGYKNPSKAIGDHLEEDERSNVSLGRQGKANIINESGLYSLIVRSNKPQAKVFRKWVTSEVLPAIRKTGQYVAKQQSKQGRLAIVLEDYQAAVAMAKMIGLDGNQAFLAADKMMRNMTGISPLAQLEMLHLVCETQERNLTPTEIASFAEIKGLASTAQQVNVVLEQMGFQAARYTGKQKTWVPTEKGRPFAVLLDANKSYNCGTPVKQLKWKESVAKAIKEYFANMDMEM